MEKAQQNYLLQLMKSDPDSPASFKHNASYNSMNKQLQSPKNVTDDA